MTTLLEAWKPLFERGNPKVMGMNLKYYKDENPVRVELNGVSVGKIEKLASGEFRLITEPAFQGITVVSTDKMEIARNVDRVCSAYILGLILL